MITYLLINAFIILVPILLSFESKVKFYKRLKAYFFSIAIVSTLFIFWDIFATSRGDWAFNTKYTIGIELLHLPIEEILFFVTVPYSIIFIYESLNSYFENYIYSLNKSTFLIFAIIFFILSFLVLGLNYTYILCLFISLSFFIIYFLDISATYSQNFWNTIIISYIPFLLINYLLTSIPVVTYNDSENFGIRLITIPIEDIGYSFAMITMWLTFYEFGKKKFLNYE